VSRRIVIAGISGNGKTTLGRRLARRLGVPFTELDALMHQPGWVPAEIETFRREVEAVIAASDGWVVDGMYQAQLGDLVLRRADTLVWLDQPLPLVLRRLVKRAVKDIVTKRDLFNGNRQTWRYALFTRDSLIGFAIKSHFKRRREWPEGIGAPPDLEIVRLRSPGEVDRWLECQAPG
jgi:adenylate kinase family enzyme